MKVYVDCVCDGRKFRTYDFLVPTPLEATPEPTDDKFIREAKSNLIFERLARPPFYHIQFVVRRSQN